MTPDINAVVSPPSRRRYRRIVIKLGTGILTSGIGCLDTDRISQICDQVAALRRCGTEVILVSSGAIGLGMGRLNLKRKPRDLTGLQKCAAIGQSILTETWQQALLPYSIIVAQLLLTREDVRSRQRHLAAKNLLEALLADGIVPVINENDSISTAEIKFGDNDVLSALTASMTRADLLIILSTAPGLVDRTGTGRIIPIVERIGPEHEAMAGSSESITGTGGMVTKLQAAKLASRSGCGVFIGSGLDPAIISQIIDGTAEGTLFLPCGEALQSRKRWIAFFATPKGRVVVDGGAVQALREQNRSLLAKGLKSVEGNFENGDVIAIADPEQRIFAHGICNYASVELPAYVGKSNQEIKANDPKRSRVEVVHKDSLVVI